MEMEYNLSEIDQVADELIQIIKEHKVIAFHGSMGAGKTTLIQAICKKMGVKDSMGSPTFSIINVYSYPEASAEGSPTNSETAGVPSAVASGSIHHMDLYRLKNEAEAMAAGVEDALYSNTTCFVEWPEKAPALLPENTLHLFIELKEGNTRCIKTTEIV